MKYSIYAFHAWAMDKWNNLPFMYGRIDGFKYAVSWRRSMKRIMKSKNKKVLTLAQKRDICKAFRGMYPKAMTPTSLFHSFYSQSNGLFDYRYLPDDLYYSKIDRYFNNWDAAKYIDNKCLYGRLFPNVRQPKTVALRLNGAWLDESYVPLTAGEVRIKLASETEVIIKLATDSLGGKGITFVGGEDLVDDAMNCVASIKGDVVIQRVLKQHSELAKLNSESVNTIRFISFLKEGKAKIYSSILRMGVDGARVDNASSGGITCGITDSGRLKPVAYSPNGDKYLEHPTSKIAFDSVTIPAFSKARRTIENLHASFPLFRLISWDVAIDESGEPTLIEANLCNGELDFHQLNNGPLFGEDTERILKEVFGK